MIEPTPHHLSAARQMRSQARRGWYTGDVPSLNAFGVRRLMAGVTEPELTISLLLSRDKMHHSVGWWRNAEYEYCWHLSIAARVVDRDGLLEDATEWEAPNEQVPRAEAAFWAHLIFEGHAEKLWFEPGGTDPRLTREEARAHATMWHMRLFMDPETIDERLLPWTGLPFIPRGEVYNLTRWIPGLTPEKVDR